MSCEEPNYLELEQIDCENNQACEHGENSCQRKRLAFWSIDLHVAKRYLSIWVILKSRLRRKLSINAIMACAKSLNIAIDTDTPKKTINESVSCLQQEVKSIHKNTANKRDDMMHNNTIIPKISGTRTKQKD